MRSCIGAGAWAAAAPPVTSMATAASGATSVFVHQPRSLVEIDSVDIELLLSFRYLRQTA